MTLPLYALTLLCGIVLGWQCRDLKLSRGNGSSRPAPTTRKRGGVVGAGPDMCATQAPHTEGPRPGDATGRARPDPLPGAGPASTLAGRLAAAGWHHFYDWAEETPALRPCGLCGDRGWIPRVTGQVVRCACNEPAPRYGAPA